MANSERSKGTKSKSSAKSGGTQRTTDIDEIKQWAVEREGKPAAVKSTMKRGDPGILRIDFPGYSGEDSLEEISWEEWGRKFEESDLEFLYQDETEDGETSRFFKLVSRGSD